MIDHQICRGFEAQGGKADFHLAIGLDLLIIAVEDGHVQKADVCYINALLFQNSAIICGLVAGKFFDGKLGAFRQHAFFGADRDLDAAVSCVVNVLGRELRFCCGRFFCFRFGSCRRGRFRLGSRFVRLRFGRGRFLFRRFRFDDVGLGLRLSGFDNGLFGVIQ